MIIPTNPIGSRRFSKIETVLFTSTGNQSYSVKAGTTHLQVEMWGGGGGGAAGRTFAVRGNTNYVGGPGGGSGAYTYVLLQEDFKKDDTVNFTVGTAGMGGTGNGGSGTGGGNTTLDTYKRGGSTLVTYSNKSAGGGGGGINDGISDTAGAAGITNGGISPSTNGNSGGGKGNSGTVCSSGGGGGTAVSTVLTRFSNGGICPNTAAGDGSSTQYGDAGGGGLHGPAVDNITGGDGTVGRVKVTAWGYFPPEPFYFIG